jgi:hypothetical protein
VASGPALDPQFLEDTPQAERLVIDTTSKYGPLRGKIIIHKSIATPIQSLLDAGKLGQMKFYALPNWATNTVFTDNDLSFVLGTNEESLDDAFDY